MFDGVESPHTQTFGLGVFDEVTNADLDKIEMFFKQRGAPVLHEVSPLADASLFALLTSASTVPESCRQGAQNALLQTRLRFAADQGCTIAVMGALPGSESQRNAEKNNFRVAYIRTKWQLYR